MQRSGEGICQSLASFLHKSGGPDVEPGAPNLSVSEAGAVIKPVLYLCCAVVQVVC